MKKMGDHMKALGFNEKSSDDAKKAFMKYLIREAQSYEKVLPLNPPQSLTRESKDEPAETQLSLFDFTGTDY